MRPPRRFRRDFALIQLLPNMLTIIAICAGLTAIRFAIEGNYLLAVQLILLAGVLDGIDGRIARLLGSSSKMGAELDSLADFLNFGVAPALLLHVWALQPMRSAGWIAVLAYAVCCVLRLARFNVAAKEEDTGPSSAYFTGVPSPAGALLVLLPMYFSFAFSDRPVLPEPLIALWMIVVGLLMISRIPTWSFKATRVSRENVKFLLVGIAITLAVLLTYAWAALIVLCAGYVAMVVWALLAQAGRRQRG